MKRHLIISALAIGAAQAVAAQSADPFPFEFEHPTVREARESGPAVFVNDQNWEGASQIQIYTANDLTLSGTLGMGLQANFALSPDGQRIYTVSGYYKRITWGEGENVLEVFDAKTLKQLAEIALPLKAAQYTADASLMRVSADGRFAYIQNATPATSVSVVNLETLEFVQEVPLPGCFGIYPRLEGYAFASICANGAFQTVTLDAQGQTVSTLRGEQIFDPDVDPIQLAMDRFEGDMFFISNAGDLLRVNDEGPVPTLVSRVSVTEGAEFWVPGGYSLLTINDAHGIAFIPMHEAEAIGTHHEGSSEIWAYDIEAGEVLYRSPIEHINSVFVTDDAEPVLFGLSLMNGSLERFEIDPAARFAVKRTHEKAGISFATVLDVRLE